MAGSVVAVLSAILKEDYMPPVNENIHNEVLITSRLGVNTKDIVGNQAVMALHVGRSGGIGARREMESLPAAGYQPYDKVVYDLSYLYARVQITGQVMQKTKNGQGSFVVNVLKDEMERIKDDLANDLARQLYGDGSGKVAQCGASGPSTTVAINVAEPLEKGYLYKGLIVDIGTVANPVSIATQRTIESVDPVAKEIVISGAGVTVTTAAFVFIYGNNYANETKEIENGLQTLLPTAANTVGGLDGSAAGYEYWDNIRSDSGSGPLTYDALLQMTNRVRIAGGETSAMITSFGVQRQYFNLLQSQVRYQEPETLRGGFKVLTFDGQPFIADRHAPYGKIFFLDEKWIQPFADGDWRFLEEDGTVIKWVTDYDAWQAAIARYMEVGIKRRNVQGLIYGIADAGY